MVCTHCAGLNRLILPVQDDLLPGRVWCVEKVVASDHEDTIIVELLYLLDRSQTTWVLPVMVVDPGLA